jgi:hypothetical protein
MDQAGGSFDPRVVDAFFALGPIRNGIRTAQQPVA